MVNEQSARQREVSIGREHTGRRLDAVLAVLLPERSRAAWQEAIAAGLVRLDGRTVKVSHKVHEGQQIMVSLPAAAPLSTVDLALDIVFADDDLLVVNKPAGLVVHPAAGMHEATLVDALLGHGVLAIEPGDDSDDDTGEDVLDDVVEQRPGIVHRLDRGTSGLLVVARHRAAQAHLSAQFKARSVRKYYWALVEGKPRPGAGAIEAPIGRNPRYRARMGVVAGGKSARTTYRTNRSFARHTLLDVGLETGRTHQIRVHLAAIGHPVAGDTFYGVHPPTIPLGRQFLHAYHLEIDSPSHGGHLVFDIGLPSDLQAIVDTLSARDAARRVHVSDSIQQHAAHPVDDPLMVV